MSYDYRRHFNYILCLATVDPDHLYLFTVKLSASHNSTVHDKLPRILCASTRTSVNTKHIYSLLSHYVCDINRNIPLYLKCMILQELLNLSFFPSTCTVGDNNDIINHLKSVTDQRHRKFCKNMNNYFLNLLRKPKITCPCPHLRQHEMICCSDRWAWIFPFDAMHNLSVAVAIAATAYK